MKNGDFIKIDFVGRVSGTGEIFDLTDPDVARKEGIFNPKQKYEPALVIMGAKMVIPGVEKRLLEMKLGDEREFSVKPEDAFGSRNAKLIKIISRANFLRQKINPVPGLFVTIDRRQARIQSVSGGRIRVDFNHPLAGKELHYKLKIMKKITATKEKIESLLDYYGLKSEPELKQGTLTIKTEKPLDKIIEKIISDTVKKWIKEAKVVKFATTAGSEKKKEISDKVLSKVSNVTLI